MNSALSLVVQIREMVKSERTSSPVHVVQPINRTLNELEIVIRGSGNLQLELDEGDRQLVLLALAVLSLESPGFDDALNRIAVRMDNVEKDRGVMYDEFRQLRARPEEHRACPCLHTTPCQPDCTCIKPFMSHGCMRCCSYGSPEQQKAMAEHLAPVIDNSWEHKP